MKFIISSFVALSLAFPAYATSKPQPLPQWAVEANAKAEAKAAAKANSNAVSNNKNVNNNNNVLQNNNKTVSNNKNKQAQQQKQRQQQAQAQRADSSSNNRNNVNVEGDNYEAAASSAIAAPLSSTSPCVKGGSVAAQGMDFGLGLSIDRNNDRCWYERECYNLGMAYGPRAQAICTANYSIPVHRTMVQMGLISEE